MMVFVCFLFFFLTAFLCFCFPSPEEMHIIYIHDPIIYLEDSFEVFTKKFNLNITMLISSFKTFSPFHSSGKTLIPPSNPLSSQSGKSKSTCKCVCEKSPGSCISAGQPSSLILGGEEVGRTDYSTLFAFVSFPKPQG